MEGALLGVTLSKQGGGGGFVHSGGLFLNISLGVSPQPFSPLRNPRFPLSSGDLTPLTDQASLDMGEPLPLQQWLQGPSLPQGAVPPIPAE